MSNQNWVFLRGLTRGNIHWGDFPQVLKKNNPDVKMELLEIPGNGELFQQKSPTNCLEVIKILRASSQFCQTKTPFNICGISLGGMIALKWAELYPEELNSLVVINTSLKQFSPFTHRLLPHNYFNIIKSLCISSCHKQEQILLEMTSNDEVAWKKKISHYTQYATTHTISRKNFARQLLLAGNVFLEKIPLKVPTKIICSKNDRLVFHGCSAEIANKLASKIYYHPTAGHDLPLDAPEWLAEMLLN